MKRDAANSGSRMVITAERWQTLERLIDAALDLAPDQRPAFLARACSGDAVLLAQVEQLMAELDHKDSLIDTPAAERFASLFDAGVTHLPAVLAGRYRLEREIAQGGMATVYVAWDVRHERQVAVKVLHPHFAALLGPARFLAEIKTTAQMRSPHILPLHDSGEADGLLFYVMPYVEGGSLRQRLEEEKRLPVDVAVGIAAQLAIALDAAHQHGVIHRDIKPENILLDGGSALLADFGISLVALNATPRLTQSGTTPGTPQYMSPEQAAEKTVDARSDVYSLGAVVYEMITGEPPFSGSSLAAVVMQRATTPPLSVRALDKTIPAALDAVLMRALATDPADRYRSAGEFAEALRVAIAPGRAPHPLARIPLRAPAFAVAAVVACVAILVAVVWPRWREAASRPALDPQKIVIVPFAVTGADASLDYLAEGFAVLLAPMFTGEGGPLAVDSRTAISAWNRASTGGDGDADAVRAVARGLGAGSALFGNVVFASGRLTVTANIVDAGDAATRPLSSVSGPVDSIPALLDGLVRQILVRQAGGHERTVAEMTTQSIPALRAYLEGREAYRRAHIEEAIEGFDRALDTDPTFALAALDLAIATTALRQMHCMNGDCNSFTSVWGAREAGPRRNDELFDRAIKLAWESRTKLGPRDIPMLEALHGPEDNTKPRWASEMLADLRRAADAAPDRAEAHYLVGLLVLFQGHAVGMSDAFERAEEAFNRAIRLDSGYNAPRARLVDVAAYQRDSDRLRRLGGEYVARDSVGATADYVRWRVAAGTSDAAALRSLRARFDSLDVSSLTQIMIASQMSGIELADADRAATIIISRSETADRQTALYWASVLALNRGRPLLADSLLQLYSEAGAGQKNLWRTSTQAALYGDGDSASAATNQRVRARWLATDTTGKNGLLPIDATDAFQEGVWALAHGRTGEAEKLVDWLRRQADDREVLVADMLIATATGRSDAAALRERVDSASRTGCCRAPRWINLVLANAYLTVGADSQALAALQRGTWSHPTLFLSTHLRRQGEASVRSGDRGGAIRYYEHYLALRSDPEPSLRPQRDSVRAELERLRRGS